MVMAGTVMKSGLILYYNVQNQSDRNESCWQKCVIDITNKKFLMWHNFTKENGDILQGSVQLGSGYEILNTENCEISSDSPTVPKEYKLSQLFGIKKTEFKFTYWFIDTTEEQEWITLIQSYINEKSSRSSSPLLDDSIDNSIDSDKQKKKTHINEDEYIVYKKCQFPIIEQPKAHIGTSSVNKTTFQSPDPVTLTAAEIATDDTCCEICIHFFCYPLTILNSCTKMHGPSYHTAHVPNDNCCGNCDCCDSCDCGSCDCSDCNGDCC